MGCVTSKEKKRCRFCGSKETSSLARTYSVPLHVPVSIHHPAQCDGQSYHMVSLTSSTLGSVKLDSLLPIHHDRHDYISTIGTLYEDDDDSYDVYNYNGEKKQKNNSNCQDKSQSKEVFQREILIAKTWSDMINQKIPKVVPKTPITTPPGEPETINTWELMEGLEESIPPRLPILTDRARCFSFHAGRDSSVFDPSTPKLDQEIGGKTHILTWSQMSNSDPDPNPNPKPVVSNFDPEIILSFRKALEEISPTNTSILRSPEREKIASPVNNRWSKAEAVEADKVSSGCQCPAGWEKKVVIYFTSLRGVRKTYEDCCEVRLIMKGLGVRLDERDLSMHYEFKEELKEFLGDGFRTGLPKVFVKGNYIGGVDEIRQLHEDGGLEKLVQGCEKVDDDGGGVCQCCGDIRFVPCERCSGSCKIYYEGEEEEEEEEKEEDEEEEDDEQQEENEATECGFIRCGDCNENGLVRCPVCCC